MPKRPTEGTQEGPPPVIGLEEIADMLGMTKPSVMNRRGRDQITRRQGGDDPYLFPDQDWVISGNPVWKPATIKRWAKLTGRMDKDGNPTTPKPGPRTG
jgi:hypothetical protein